MSDIECVVPAGAGIGECPVWDDRNHLLYWTDIPGKKLHRYDPYSRHDADWDMPEELGAIGLRDGNGLVLALRSGFFIMEFIRPAPYAIAPLRGEPAGNRLNDGRIDPAGRFWSGTVNEQNRDPTGALYCLHADLRVEKKIAGIACSNSLCWSPDGKILYHADSFEWRIDAWDFDAASGAIANRRPFIEIPRDEGFSDGATIDAEGCLWAAHWGHGHLKRYDPEGKFIRTIELPVTNITCPAFGGADLDVLYVTSGTFRLTEEQRAAQPLAGGLFALDPGVKGLPEKRFKS